MPFPVLGSNSAVAEFAIDNSLRFNDDDSARLSRSQTNGNQDKWTWSVWVKRGNISSDQCFFATSNGSTTSFDAKFKSSDAIEIYNYFGGGFDSQLITNRLFRDVSAWYHIVVVYDSGNATESDRLQIYINGTEETSFSTTNYPSLNADSDLNVSGSTLDIGRQQNGSQFFDGYMSEINFVDGQALAPTEFGETNDNGVWIPKAYSGTYGTNGFFLQFQDSSNLGDDTSGNGNDFTATNLTATDQTTDTPTNNFATMNPVHKSIYGTNNLPTFSEGNVKIAMNTDTSTSSTIAPASGKWYVEYKQSENTADNSGYPIVGISATLGGAAGDIIGFRTPSGSNYRGQLGTSSIDNAFLSARLSGDIFGFYIDLDNSTLIIHKNGSTYMNTGYTGGLDWSSGLTTTNTQTGFYHFYVQNNASGTPAFTDEVNFGNPSFSISSSNSDANGYGSFEYSPTLGGTNYYALCTKNLAEYG
tara:strand:- start:24 stop:1442 length:1419 start_codon:yes stop_codon:yes gene_type:complete